MECRFYGFSRRPLQPIMKLAARAVVTGVRSMSPRTSPLALVAALCAMSMASTGCTDAFTVHSIIEKPNEPGAPHGG
jgi:hypothetical protein